LMRLPLVLVAGRYFVMIAFIVFRFVFLGCCDYWRK
jgi:hypothetical protein